MKRTSRRGTKERPVRQVLFGVLALLLLLALSALSLTGSTQPVHADDNHGVTPIALAATGTPVQQSDEPGFMPTSEIPHATTVAEPSGRTEASPVGWEAEALRDLAEVLDWPPVVTRDSTDKLSVERVISSTEWSSAMIRPFGSPAGAAGAFAAEQEDARLSSYYVSTDGFNSYPSYWASQNDSTGQQVRLRFHWLAGSWIMGVESVGPNVRTSELRSRAQQLLTLALQYGLPSPSGSASPSPTSVSPTATQSPPSNCGITFSDVSASLWAYNYISQLACKHVVSGYSDGTFRPLNSTSRAQLVKMLVLSEGWSLVNSSQPSYRDVSASHIFYRYIETATARGIISGFADDTFRPDLDVSRAQVAKMVVRSRNWPTHVTSPVLLCDVPARHWAYGYIQVAIEHGIFTGYGDGCFRPDEPATRAQLAKVIVLSRQ